MEQSEASVYFFNFKYLLAASYFIQKLDGSCKIYWKFFPLVKNPFIDFDPRYFSYLDSMTANFLR